MDILTSTQSYEAWMGRHITLRRADLDLKHKRMHESAFVFLRATFYQWLRRWPEVCGELVDAPAVLAVGDVHIENFGTWRDHEGRLIWGVNDVDEACRLPYTQDLVRLATSALLAIRAGHFALPTTKGAVPHAVLRSSLPERTLQYRVARRIAGAGSLGRPRFVAIAEWRGGLIAREAKALLPSAAAWVRGSSSTGTARARSASAPLALAASGSRRHGGHRHPRLASMVA